MKPLFFLVLFLFSPSIALGQTFPIGKSLTYSQRIMEVGEVWTMPTKGIKHIRIGKTKMLKAETVGDELHVTALETGTVFLSIDQKGYFIRVGKPIEQSLRRRMENDDFERLQMCLQKDEAVEIAVVFTIYSGVISDFTLSEGNTSLKTKHCLANVLRSMRLDKDRKTLGQFVGRFIVE